MVDIWHDLPNKDAPGWREFAQIVSVQEVEGNAIARFQGKTLDHRSLEVRAHVPYLVYLSCVFDQKAHQFGICRTEVDKLLPSAFLIVDVVHDAGALGHHIANAQ